MKLLPLGGEKMRSDLDEDVSSNRFIQKELHKKLDAIGEHLESDVICVIAPMASGIDDLVRDAIEDISDRRPRLLVVLETDGGSIEVVERIADLFRHHYPAEVSFLIPSQAMSAGTVLAMSGDSIYMDYYSLLGPIDPQVRSNTGTYVPALGYLEKYQEFIEKDGLNGLTDAEIAFFVAKFDPAELHQFEQARDLSIELLKKWLVKYKFKNWTVTRTTNIPVTAQMKEDRAAQIAMELNNVKTWKSHGRGLSMKVVDQDLNLLIEDFGADATLNERVRTYSRLLRDYMHRVSHEIVIHTPKAYRGF